jgi:hypothetical protein
MRLNSDHNVDHVDHHVDHVDEADDDLWDGHIATRDDVDHVVHLDHRDQLDQLDLSEAFWGGTREWSDEGPAPRTARRRDPIDAVPRVRRRGERTGPIARTRTHRVVPPRVDVDVVDVALDRDSVVGDHVGGAGTLAARLGLGRVDPRIVRIGVIVAIVVLLVPLVLALRPSSPRPTVTTGSPAAVGAAGFASVMPLAASVVADVAPAATHVAAQTVIDPSTLPRAPIINPDVGTASRPTELPAAGDSSSASPAPLSGDVAEAAQTDVPAARVARPCPRRYTIGQGDYWLRLADGADVPLTELLQLNGATVDTPLYPGAEICLPQTASAPSTTSTPAAGTLAPPYVWVDGDTAQKIIRDVWPDDLEEQALQVAQRESNFVVTARNHCCYGLFQIYWSVHRGWLDDLGITSAAHLYDARLNATAALHLYMRSGGWGPWT